MVSKPIKRITENLHQAGHILLLTHQDPDPDAIGSTMALKLLLEAQRKRVSLHYVISSPKALPPIAAGILTYDKRVTSNIPKIQLGEYDYVLVLDTSFSLRHILGLEFEGTPVRGVGIIDHHTRTDETLYPEQDHTEPDKSSVCEILYDFIDQTLYPFAQQPTRLRRQVTKYLLHGMLDDMVGLLIPEKLSSHNLDILFTLKGYVGKKTFDQTLQLTRTLTLPNPLEQYAKFLSHTSYIDKLGHKYHLYLLQIPEGQAALFKRDYTNLLFLFEHYARTSCAKQGWQYGGFLLTIDGFAPGISKISARGSFMKQLFTPLLREKGLFLSAGISGDSAVGGKVTNRAEISISALLKQRIKQLAPQLILSSKYDASSYQELEARAEILISG